MKMAVDEFSIECLVVSTLLRLQIIMPLTQHECEQVPAFISRKGNRKNEVCVHAYGAVTLAHTYYCCTNPRVYKSHVYL